MWSIIPIHDLCGSIKAGSVKSIWMPYAPMSKGVEFTSIINRSKALLLFLINGNLFSQKGLMPCAGFQGKFCIIIPPLKHTRWSMLFIIP